MIVDGANVVGSRPDGWWRDRPGAAQRLQGELTAAGVDAVLVLEGAARAGVAKSDVGAVRVVHADGSGDDEIVAQVRLAALGVVVVTADRGLRERVTALGAQVRGPGWLWERLEG